MEDGVYLPMIWGAQLVDNWGDNFGDRERSISFWSQFCGRLGGAQVSGVQPHLISLMIGVIMSLPLFQFGLFFEGVLRCPY